MKSISAKQATTGRRESPTKLLRAALRVEMAEQGFTGASSDYFKKLNDETTLWIGVQVLRDRRPLLGLFPQVGFINWKMASFAQRVLNVTTHVNTTLIATLGYLMPEPLQLEWYFSCDETEIRKAARGVVQNACGYGMPFMTRFPDLHALRAWAEEPSIEPEAMTTWQPYLTRAVVLLLDGDWKGAMQIVDAEIARAGDDLDDPNDGPLIRLRDHLYESRQVH